MASGTIHQECYIFSDLNIGYTSNETTADRAKRFWDNYAPVGIPWAGQFSAASKYFTTGFKYISGGKYYGNITIGSYNNNTFFRINADSWVEEIPVQEYASSMGRGIRAHFSNNHDFLIYSGKLNTTQNYLQVAIDGVDKGYIIFDVSRNVG